MVPHIRFWSSMLQYKGRWPLVQKPLVQQQLLVGLLKTAVNPLLATALFVGCCIVGLVEFNDMKVCLNIVIMRSSCVIFLTNVQLIQNCERSMNAA